MTIADDLLSWYDEEARELPWRTRGDKRPDPYRVLLSEIMLQQTTVAAVKPYFAAFLARWPTVSDLAAADDADVMTAWAGLGYYARARNLLAAARRIGDRFPQTEDELRMLPGVGRYTAAAIASIAFGKRAVVVDGNVERVVARLFAVETPLPKARAELYRLTETLTPDTRPGDFAQAMMDLGRVICSPRSPKCDECPIRSGCRGRHNATRYPVKAPRRARPQRSGAALWITENDKVWLLRRPQKGLLGGMRALPSGGWDGTECPPPGHRLGIVSHSFTHFELTLAVDKSSCALQPGGEWWPIKNIADAGLPTIFMKAALLAIREDPE